ncbi:MAG: GAF domain-containing protein [Pseudomonadota bacterium]
MTLQPDAIRACFEGVIPGTIATADLDATPNIAYVSQVQYIDAEHIALSYQFFNKTRQNLLATRYGMVMVTDPHTAAQYRMKVEFLRTERAGPLFESMKAKLAGLASHAGMSDVFQLLGADVFRVHTLDKVPGPTLDAPPQRRNLLTVLRRVCEQIRLNGDLEQLLAQTLACLEHEFGIEHAMALLYDEAGQRLYTLASRGYPVSGVGSEIVLGDGVIGVAARERTPIRISHTTSEYSYNRAIRHSTMDAGFGVALETEIPLPGLAESRSQLAVPVMAAQRLIGVLFVESRFDLRFSYDDEDALVTLAGQLGMAIQIMQSQADLGEEAPRAGTQAQSLDGEVLTIRHFPENDSVFLGDDYLIKGVAGSIFAMLVSDSIETGRTEFTNRELRLDARIRLPDVSDNLEARLLLLSRRLTERSAPIRIEKTGRGRFRLCTDRPLRFLANCT